MKKHCIYFFCCILIFVSCRKEVKTKYDDFPPLPVVNSIIVAGEPVQIHLSLTTKINSKEFARIENARILLYVDDIFVEELSYLEDGLYESSTIAEAEKEYSCKVIVPNYDTVFCENKIPQPKRMLDLKYIPVAGLDEEGFPHPGLELTFENDPSQRLYYEVKIMFPIPKNDYYETPDYEYPYIMPNNDPLITREGMNRAVFSNEGITGDSYKLHLNYKKYGSDKIAIVEFRTVSYAYYQYFKTRYLYEQGYYSDALDGYAPSSLYSNIENGYGIFAGYSLVQSDTIYLN